jgi:hypothetical protein
MARACVLGAGGCAARPGIGGNSGKMGARVRVSQMLAHRLLYLELICAAKLAS